MVVLTDMTIAHSLSLFPSFCFEVLFREAGERCCVGVDVRARTAAVSHVVWAISRTKPYNN